MNQSEFFISGGISGAITDPNSVRALKHAELFYEEIRKTDADVPKIAENTGFTVAQISHIKAYLFIDKHQLATGYKTFDPCFEIAESWRRLAFDKEHIQPHDLTLIRHEVMEMKLIFDGVDQQEAHNITERKYNYEIESRDFYRRLTPRHNKYVKTDEESRSR